MFGCDSYFIYFIYLRILVYTGLPYQIIICFPTVRPRVAIVEQDLLTSPKHLSSDPVLNSVRLGQPVHLGQPVRAVFCRSLFFLLSFLFDHCVVCPTLVYDL